MRFVWFWIFEKYICVQFIIWINQNYLIGIIKSWNYFKKAHCLSSSRRMASDTPESAPRWSAAQWNDYWKTMPLSTWMHESVFCLLYRPMNSQFSGVTLRVWLYFAWFVYDLYPNWISLSIIWPCLLRIARNKTTILMNVNLALNNYWQCYCFESISCLSTFVDMHVVSIRLALTFGQFHEFWIGSRTSGRRMCRWIWSWLKWVERRARAKK